MVRLGLLLVFISQLCFASNNHYTHSPFREISFQEKLHRIIDTNFEILVPLIQEGNFWNSFKVLPSKKKWNYVGNVNKYFDVKDIPDSFSVVHDDELDHKTYVLCITKNDTSRDYKFVILQNRHDNKDSFTELQAVVTIFYEKLRKEQLRAGFNQSYSDCCSIQ